MEQANTIAQMRKIQDPSKLQLQVGWKGQKRSQDEQPVQDAQGPRKRVLESFRPNEMVEQMQKDPESISGAEARRSTKFRSSIIIL